MADFPSHRLNGHNAREQARRTTNPRVSVVVPCMNEERNLTYFFSRMPANVDEVVLVDGRSVDRTVERAKELWPSVRVVHQTRRGKGNALVCGFLASTGDIIVMIDADGSTDPAEIPSFVDALKAGADFAKGSRFMAGGGSHDITWIRKLGNAGLSMFVNALFHTRYSDLCYGYNAFWRDAMLQMELPEIHQSLPAGQSMIWGDGFEIETLVNVRVAGAGLKITEVPSLESERIHGVSNLNAFADGRRVLRTIMDEYRSRHRQHKRHTSSADVTAEMDMVTAGLLPMPAEASTRTSAHFTVGPAPLLSSMRSVAPATQVAAAAPAGAVVAEEH